MEDNKSAVYTKAVDKDGFMLSLTAKQESIEDALVDMYHIIEEYELKPWHDSSNLLDRVPVVKNLVDDAKELGAVRNLGVKTLPPTKEQAEAGDAYEIGVSMYSFDGEYLKWFKKLRDGKTNQYGINPIKVGTPSWDEFELVFPDWQPEVSATTELPMGPVYLYYEVSDRTNGQGNNYHDLKGVRDA